MARFSPSGVRVALMDDYSVRIWDVATGRHVKTFQAPEDAWCLSFDPTGSRLAAGCDEGTVHVWDLGEKDGEKRFTVPLSQVEVLSFSPDGRRLAMSGGYAYRMEVWDLELGVRLYSLEGPALSTTLRSRRTEHCWRWPAKRDRSGSRTPGAASPSDTWRCAASPTSRSVRTAAGS